MGEGDTRITGRDDQVAQILSIIESPDPDAQAVLLEGEPGVGKTALWETLVARSRGDEARVLAARAVQAEVRLSFAVLGDLLEPLLEDLPQLAARHRRALEIALRQNEDHSSHIDSRSLGLGVLSLLKREASRCSLVIAIDDVQWIDAPSRRVLAFALRRFTERARILLTVRTESEDRATTPLRDVFEPDRLTVIPVLPLSIDDLTRVLAERLGLRPGRVMIERLHALSGGNPLYALELARSAGDELAELDVALPRLPSTLQRAVADRLGRLDEGARTAAIVVAAQARPTLTSVKKVLELSNAPDDAVESAVETGVVAIEGSRLRLGHPLFGAVLHSALPLRRRLELHRVLARSAQNEEERARHLALATIEPDEEVAILLDAAAASAYSRGAPDAAAELADRARRLTPPDDPDAAIRRTADAAGFFLEAGNVRVAERFLEQAMSVAAAGDGRTRCLQMLARFRFFSGDLGESQRLYEEAVKTQEPSLRAAAKEGLGNVAWLRGDGPAAVAHGRSAAEDFARVDDRIGVAEALAEAAYAQTLLGEGVPKKRFDEVLEMEDQESHVRVLRRPSFWATLPYLWVDDIAGQVDALRVLVRKAMDEADELSSPMALQAAVEAKCRLGDIAGAKRDAQNAIEAASPSGRGLARDAVEGALGFLAAITGDIEQARSLATEGIAFGERTDCLISDLRHRSVLALTELSMRNYERVIEIALPLVERMERAHYREPWALRFVPDLVEALLATGRRKEADENLAGYEVRATRLGRLTAMAAAKRCRALSLIEDDRLEDAEKLLIDALSLHRRCGDRFAEGRTMLALGMLQRRAKRRNEARSTLRSAELVFEGMQAPVWAERARAEAGRIGGRTSSPLELTPTEQQIADLVEQGLTNKEIAGRLFVTPKTVEANLTRIYRKLGITSRSELRRKISAPRPLGDQT